MRRRLGAALLAVAAIVPTACRGDADPPQQARDPSSGSSSPDTSTTTAPPGPGSLVDAEVLDEPDVDGTVWRVRYRSTGIGGNPVEVSGLVARPDGPAPEGGFPTVSWAHGTTGVADACAPSARGAAGVPGLEAFLAAGYVVAATDYEGLGTPGVHPYLVSESEARSVLDSARAAASLVDDVSGQVLVAGASQGGHAALAAAERASEWAPELDVVGTVAVAPAADLELIAPVVLAPGGGFGFAVLVVAGWAAAYDDLAETDVLGPAGLAMAERARREACVTELVSAASQADGELVSATLEDVPAWQRRVSENTIDPSRVRGPVFVVQGTEDPIIPRELTDLLASDLCDAGVRLRYTTYEGADHGGAAVAAFPDIVDWAADRLDGEPPETTCG